MNCIKVNDTNKKSSINRRRFETYKKMSIDCKKEYLKRYYKLSVDSRNLANYFNLLKNKAYISLLRDDELKSVYEYNIGSEIACYNRKDLEREFVSNVSRSYDEKECTVIPVIERIANKISFDIREISVKDDKKTNNRDILKYNIVSSMVNNSEAFSEANLLDLNDKAKKQEFIDKLSRDLNVLIDSDKVTKEFLDKLNRQLDEYLKFANSINSLSVISYIFNLVNYNNSLSYAIAAVKKRKK